MTWHRGSYYNDCDSDSDSESYSTDSDNETCPGCDGECGESSCNDHHVARFLLSSPLTENALASPNSPSTMVYRACMADMPWDRFTPFNRPTDPDVAFRLWAAGGRHARKFWDGDDLDDHIQMGWDEGTDSPFISFSNDLEWAVYFTLKQEFVGDEKRRLFQIQVPDDHLFEYDGDDETSAAFVESASEVFAHRFVDVYAYEALEICPRARGVAKAWFAERAKMRFPAYPFLEWSEHMRDVLDSGCE